MANLELLTWHITDDNPTEANLTPERQRIVEILKASPTPLSSKQIAERYHGKKDLSKDSPERTQTRMTVSRMVHAGLLVNDGTGGYSLTGNLKSSVPPVPPVPPVPSTKGVTGVTGCNSSESTKESKKSIVELVSYSCGVTGVTGVTADTKNSAEHVPSKSGLPKQASGWGGHDDLEVMDLGEPPDRSDGNPGYMESLLREASCRSQ